MTVTEISLAIGQARTTFANRFKDEYVPAWEDHVHTGRELAKLIAEKKGTMGGKRTLTSVMDSYPQSTGIALFEYDDQPTPRVGTYFNPELMSRRMFSRFRWTWEVEIAARKGDKVAWAQPKAEDLRTGRIQFELNFARMLYLGPAQVLATASGANTSTSIPLYGRNARTSANDDRHKYGKQYLRKNMSIGEVASSGSAVVPYGALATSNITGSAYQNEIYITALDDSTPTAPTATVNSARTTADETILVPFRSRIDSPAGDTAAGDSDFAGPNGLMNLCVNAARKTYVYGQSRSTYPSLEGFVDDRSGTVEPWNEDRISFAVDRANDDGTGDDPDTLLCHRSIRREYVKETKGDRRFESVQKTKGYAAKLMFEAGDVMLPIITDRDCMPGLMWALETDGFGWLSEADLQQLEDGERFVANKAAHEVILVKSGNVMTRKPHNNVLIEDIQFSVTGLTAAP